MTIRAVRIHEFADPARLSIDRLDPPSSGDGALIRVAVASINPVDWKTAQGKHAPITADKLPLILGRDLAGTIETVEGGTIWSDGDRVCAMLGKGYGAQAEIVAVPLAELVRVPDGVSDDVAGAVPLAAMTAWQGLFDQGDLAAGQRVLIHGAAGGVGHLAVQFARWKGCTIFATASGKDLDFVRSLGADTVIDYRAERFEEIATDLDFVFDTQGGETQARSLATLKRGGMLVSTLDLDEAAAAAAGVRTVPRWHAQANAGELKQVLDLVADGTVRVEIARGFALDDVADAHRFAQTKHPRGKVILTL